jgi:hypothetical protein
MPTDVPLLIWRGVTRPAYDLHTPQSAYNLQTQFTICTFQIHCTICTFSVHSAHLVYNLHIQCTICRSHIQCTICTSSGSVRARIWACNPSNDCAALGAQNPSHDFTCCIALQNTNQQTGPGLLQDSTTLGAPHPQRQSSTLHCRSMSCANHPRLANDCTALCCVVHVQHSQHWVISQGCAFCNGD